MDHWVQTSTITDDTEKCEYRTSKMNSIAAGVVTYTYMFWELKLNLPDFPWEKTFVRAELMNFWIELLKEYPETAIQALKSHL